MNDLNKETTPISSTILRNKLGVLANRLQKQAASDGSNASFATMEETVTEALSILSKFYKGLSKPGFEPSDIRFDTIPDPDNFNGNILAVLDDLTVIFAEFENMEGVVLGGFNYMVTRLNRLDKRLKTVTSRLGDYILFSDHPTKDAIFFSDSFNNLTRIEVNSPLLNKEQAEINQVEGIATLPIDRSAQKEIKVTEVPIINSSSNGRVGNNEEVGSQFHGSITDILDNNADTWFEYERVVPVDDGIGLVLDFTINIGEPRIINFIRVNPNNFGTKTQVQILSIDTSVDGEELISVKDDIPIADFAIEDEENVFTLAPSTSKYAGQGLYTFTPRKAKYVHLTLRQTTPYIIQSTRGGERSRYAIGIRDVDIQALPYKTAGQLVSTEYVSSDEIKKVVVLSNQNPTAGFPSTLASITHSISPDNGVSWYQIRPRESSGVAGRTQDVLELLDFNGVTANSVSTPNAVNRLRYRATFERNTEAFSNGSGDLAQTTANKTELHTPPTTTPFQISLENTPIDGTIKVIDPSFGSRGFDDTVYGIALGNGNKKIVRIPFVPLKKDYEKDTSSTPYTLDEIDPQTIAVDGETWTRAKLAGAGNVKRYILNSQEGTIEFGDGTNGAVVPDGSLISMRLSEERLSFEKGSDHIAKLDYPTSNDKEQIEVAIYQPLKTTTIVLKKGAKYHTLFPLIEEDPAPIFSNDTIFIDEVDTESEINEDAGNYYIDYINGVVVSQTAASTTTDTSVTFVYRPKILLTTDQWDFVDEGGINNAISISSNVFQSFTSSIETVTPNVKYFNLGNLSVVPGSVVFTGNTSALTKEVEFVDGRSELLDVVKSQQYIEPITGISGRTIISFPFKVAPTASTDFDIIFTNKTVFKPGFHKYNMPDLVGGGVGSYYLYTPSEGAPAPGLIYVVVDDNVAEPGYVSYYYNNPQAVLTGRYSINYETGEVFSYTTTEASTTVQYEYTDTRIKYRIAREVSSNDWEYDPTENRIKIKDREVLKSGRTFQTANPSARGDTRFYQISYKYVKVDRAEVSALEPYFSPILKDYAIKVMTKSRLI